MPEEQLIITITVFEHVVPPGWGWALNWCTEKSN